MKAWRIGLSMLGVLAMAYGLVELITRVPASSLARVAVWLAAAVVIHDALWSPALIGAGAALGRVPARGRRYLQGGLVIGAALTVIALPMIHLRGSQPASKAILLQNVGLNLLLLLGIVATATALAYLVRVARDRRAAGGNKRQSVAGRPAA